MLPELPPMQLTMLGRKDQYDRLNDFSAEEIHRIGIDEVARIQEEMRAIQERVGFTGSLQEFFDFVRADEQFLYPNTSG
ncbi:DUF885 family protein [Aliidiomarina iranensis]|uniref:DUF885 family protein n=1 Tax=Aliidiomarina iranensis TaxID=1434071 RepID=UPI001F5402BE|nr:DUF885 family protein [Aliidiomarina iranensis]